MEEEEEEEAAEKYTLGSFPHSLFAGLSLADDCSCCCTWLNESWMEKHVNSTNKRMNEWVDGNHVVVEEMIGMYDVVVM